MARDSANPEKLCFFVNKQRAVFYDNPLEDQIIPVGRQFHSGWVLKNE